MAFLGLLYKNQPKFFRTNSNNNCFHVLNFVKEKSLIM